MGKDKMVQVENSCIATRELPSVPLLSIPSYSPKTQNVLAPIMLCLKL